MASVMGVSIKAGETELTNSPSRAYVRESPFDNARIPAFAQQ